MLITSASFALLYDKMPLYLKRFSKELFNFICLNIFEGFFSEKISKWESWIKQIEIEFKTFKSPLISRNDIETQEQMKNGNQHNKYLENNCVFRVFHKSKMTNDT